MGRRFAVVAAGVLVSTLATACVAGAGAPSPTDPHGLSTTIAPTTTASASLEDSLERYRECLADRGIPVPTVRLDGRGRPMIAMAMAGLDFSEPALQGELDACAGVLSSGALDLTADPELRALVQSRLESFARCVGVEGVTGFPGPVDPFDGVGPPFPSDEVPWDDPLLAEAVGACVVTLGVGSR